MRSKFLDKIASVNNKKELIIASNNPFILTGLESLIAPDFLCCSLHTTPGYQ